MRDVCRKHHMGDRTRVIDAVEEMLAVGPAFASVVSPGQMTKTNNPRHRLLSNAPPLEFRPEPAAPPLVTAWTMTKKGRRAVCTIHAHPLGVEVRLDLDDELHRSEVIAAPRQSASCPTDVLIFVADWPNKWIAKGWSLPTPIRAGRAKPERAY